jgi:hypothetical protein
LVYTVKGIWAPVSVERSSALTQCFPGSAAAGTRIWILENPPEPLALTNARSVVSKWMSIKANAGKPLPETLRLVVGGHDFTESVKVGWAKHNAESNSTLRNLRQSWAFLGMRLMAGIRVSFDGLAQALEWANSDLGHLVVHN